MSRPGFLMGESRGKTRGSILLAVIIVTGCAFNGDNVSSVKSLTRVSTAQAIAPERIILTWRDDPATSQAVTWRTDSSIREAVAQIALADPSPDFARDPRQVPAQTTSLQTEDGLVYCHSVNFTELQPNTLYAYRVGDDRAWSEWFHFRTASDLPEPFSFIYLGDAQNDILSLWSRIIRSAYSRTPHARFIVHAGDLVDHAHRDSEWGEWFQAGGWIFATVPSVPTPGNHEYAREGLGGSQLSRQWRPQFTLPENGVKGLEETVFFVDFQGVRIISLNSNERQDEQAAWLKDVLVNNTNRWTVITFHHPIFSSAEGRDNSRLRALWKPLFDEFGADLVLQGHDHTYARGQDLTSGSDNGQRGGAVYVVSVSGPKMYRLASSRWMDRAGENTQLYQVISVAGDSLHYQAVTATGELYDAFDLIKQEGGANRLVERAPSHQPERTFESTSEGRP